jgi:hypothetical protein
MGGATALAAGLGAAWFMTRSDAGQATPPPASEAGLIIDSSATDDGRIDPSKPLRCFVAGQFVGELSLTACAQRNGVATDALDVGIDESGALAAAQQASQALIPLPPQDSAGEGFRTPDQEADAEVGVEPPPGSCWLHGNGRWRKLANDLDLDGCVQALFAGRCEASGVVYGRWGARTLRLTAGRVEVADDNRTFSTLVVQAADCSLPPL